jgi:hypothetical protein
MECELSKEGFLPVQLLGRNNKELRTKMLFGKEFSKNGVKNLYLYNTIYLLKAIYLQT